MTHINLIQQLERDIRNQVLIDSLKHLNRKQKTMIHLNRNSLRYAFGFCALFWMALCVTVVRADPLAAPKPPGAGECPDNQPCKVLTLTPQEEKLLVGQNGILDTAAQGRQIDLGGFAVYFKTKIATAPQGEVKPTEQPAAQGNPDKGAGPMVPANKAIDSTPK